VSSSSVQSMLILATSKDHKHPFWRLPAQFGNLARTCGLWVVGAAGRCPLPCGNNFEDSFSSTCLVAYFCIQRYSHYKLAVNTPTPQTGKTRSRVNLGGQGSNGTTTLNVNKRCEHMKVKPYGVHLVHHKHLHGLLAQLVEHRVGSPSQQGPTPGVDSQHGNG